MQVIGTASFLADVGDYSTTGGLGAATTGACRWEAGTSHDGAGMASPRQRRLVERMEHCPGRDLPRGDGVGGLQGWLAPARLKDQAG
ncbi:hypothetical protein BFF78_20340 [Streptomyces fodineus]|uniref:Uncharacterized protein n=1 Tax=Streptomyces fodineus TaxID=1904616 RepID=A0A1D7YC01_9ACTN|nr:hypothetical protein BFF78_20340 [Streptomyces fodineus]